MQSQLNHRDIQGIGNYAELTFDGLNAEARTKLQEEMLRWRRIEEALHSECFPANEVLCPMHYVERAD